MIKCIASDMDGTLLTGKGSISEENQQAIKLAQKQGVVFVVATGRSYQEAQFALKQVEITCPVICVNGAIVVDEAGEIIASEVLTSENATQIANILAELDVYFEVYSSKGTYTNNLDKAVSVMIDVFTSANHDFTKEQVEEVAKGRISEGLVHYVASYDMILSDENTEIYKLLAFSADLDKLVDARESLVELAGIAVSSSGSGNLEITSIHAQKGIALQKFISKRGIAHSETMAVGDNDNDVSMLSLVGRAVAMGNAPEHIKAQAHFVTDTNDHDGVAKAIYEALGK